MAEVICRKTRVNWRDRVVDALTALKSNDLVTVEGSYGIARDADRHAVAYLRKAQAIVRLGRVRELKSSHPALHEMVETRFSLVQDSYLPSRTVFQLNRDRINEIGRWLLMDEPQLDFIWKENEGPSIVSTELGSCNPDMPWDQDPPMDCPA